MHTYRLDWMQWMLHQAGRVTQMPELPQYQ